MKRNIANMRNDGERPDGPKLMPSTNGRCLVLDFTCPDTLEPSHLNRIVVSNAAVANDAVCKKQFKY